MSNLESGQNFALNPEDKQKRKYLKLYSLTLPRNAQSRLGLLRQVGRSSFYLHRELFATVSECLKEANWEPSSTHAVPRAAKILSDEGVPIFKIEKTPTTTTIKNRRYQTSCTILWKVDKDWAVEVLNSAKNKM